MARLRSSGTVEVATRGPDPGQAPAVGGGEHGNSVAGKSSSSVDRVSLGQELW